MLWRGRRRSLKSEWKRIGGEETRSLCSLCEKVAWFFKQQIEFLLISFLVVAESFIKTIYTCVKSIFHLLCWVYKKNNSFLSFHSSIFHSKIHKHPACKMNRDEHGESRLKIRSFEWTYFLNDPKVFLLQLRSIF